MFLACGRKGVTLARVVKGPLVCTVMTLSALVVNWNSGDRLNALLRSLQACPGLSVLVVDNDSEDLDALEPAFSPADSKGFAEWRLLRENIGFAAAVNLGIQVLTTDWILLLNPDVVVDRQSLERLKRHSQEHPQAAILTGPLLDSLGRPQTAFQFNPLPTWRSVLCDALFLDEVLGWIGLCGRALPPTGAGVEVEQPAAAYWLLRRRAWDELGGLDPGFFPAWFEDVDFCRRLRLKGWRILYFEDCPAKHQGGYSVERVGRRRFYSSYYGNLLRYLRKHHPRAYPWLKPCVQVGLWLRQVGIRK